MQPTKITEPQSGNPPVPSQDKSTSWLASKWLWIGIVVLILCIWGGIVATIHTNKPLPPGLSFEGEAHQVDNVDFLYDLSFQKDGGYQQEQMIFDRVGRAIAEAKKFVVIDMFLFNGYYHEDQSFPPLSDKLANQLLEAKQKNPDLQIAVVTDEVNTTYGSHQAPEIDRLKEAGISVVYTDTVPLRDSVPLYSAFWRIGLQWFGQSGEGWLPNPMADNAPKVTLRSYLKLFNVKANHRKVVATDQTVLLLSANPHDASFNNSNIGFEIKGSSGFIAEVLATEQAASDMSGGPKLPVLDKVSGGDKSGGGASSSRAEAESGNPVTARLLTEGKIYSRLLKSIEEAQPGDEIRMGMFYLADRQVMDRLLRASERGAHVQLLLDPNENAFGRSKIGIPNRPVAAELLRKSKGKIEVKWYNTKEEQFHTKMMYIRSQTGSAVINGGSANFTPRNLDDLNLETNVEITAPAGSKIVQDLDQYWDRIWNNRDAEYSLEYEAYEDKTVWIKRGLYRLQDMFGFTTY
ncbi:phospholipase D family protein [Paenibacillus sp. FJAT-26967]|uniref:phospholipase D family protein n=1 Tax=Paenibacillus sp. FJAT-26967 TaxID=1729690 RepID=UPI0008394A13|nr:phospholipase D family protein [Paenibacillus sp. FJAT-26967]